MRTTTLFCAAGALIALGNPVAPASAASQIDAPLGCVETVVTKVAQPANESTAGGGMMAFRDNIAPGRSAHTVINSVYLGYNDEIVAQAGNHVRVCLLGYPQKGDGCDPSSSPMGREFLVYNESTTDVGNAAVYFNTSHLCGGA